MIMSETTEILNRLNENFWQHTEFWIFLIIGVLSLIASVMAFWQAKRAKEAAFQAGTTVKIQTITIELTELVQKLDKLDAKIDYPTARDFLNEISRKIIRLIAPFKEHDDYKNTINKIYEIISKTKKGLELVKPIDKEKNVDFALQSIYYAIESNFSDLSILLAEIIGLFEKRTLKDK
jgi:preprotein translocase subunit SecF